MSTVPLAQIPAPHDTATLTLVDQLVQWARRRIDERVFRPGMRMPSIRKLALDKSVSRFTVVEAYERLVAQGYLDSRRGSGFYCEGTHGRGPATGRPRRPRGRGRAGAQHDRRRLVAAQHAAHRQPEKGRASAICRPAGSTAS
jgi:DNA-binding transcriptional MocR family regulator